MMISCRQKQSHENIWWRNVNQNITYNCPSNIMNNCSQFQSYCQKYHRSRRQFLEEQVSVYNSTWVAGVVRKIFDGEMSIRTLPTTLLQFFCKNILNIKVIIKSTIDPEDNFLRNWFSVYISTWVAGVAELAAAVLIVSQGDSGHTAAAA